MCLFTMTSYHLMMTSSYILITSDPTVAGKNYCRINLEKIDCQVYFRNYLRNRLEMEQYILSVEQFESKWCVKSVLSRVVNNKVHLLI